MAWSDVVVKILDKPSAGAVAIVLLVVVYAVPLLTFSYNVQYLAREISASFRAYCVEGRLERDPHD